jgi:hypothetical protein
MKELVHEPLRAERQRFVMKCAQGDCRGFLSTRYKCGTCEVTVRSGCHEPLAEGHVCDPATVQSVLGNQENDPQLPLVSHSDL